MNRMLEIRERVAKYGLSRIAKDEVAWWNARDELNFNAYDDLQYLLQEHTRITAEIEAMTAERDRFKAREEAAEADMKRMADDIDGETDACYPCAICAKNNSRCDTSDNCFEWRGPQEGANT